MQRSFWAKFAAILRNWWVRLLGSGVAVLAVLAGLAVAFPDQVRSVLPEGKVKDLLAAPLPDNALVTRAFWLEQCWTDEDRHWFHHATQGTATFKVPYDWFIALEQPTLRFFGQPGLLKDSDYLRKFGFIPSPRTLATDPVALEAFGYGQDLGCTAEESGARPRPWVGTAQAGNLDGLPVGFARMPGRKDPSGEDKPDQIGLTCAACHTGQLEYRGTSIRYDGGPAMIELGKFQETLGLAIGYTAILPWRFSRFAERVLGSDATEEQRAGLEKLLKKAFKRGQAYLELEEKLLAGKQHTEEGYGRLDALNRIGNQVFHENLINKNPDEIDSGANREIDRNFAVRHAPVSFPPIWDAPSFLWAQYDASILQPLVRNAGEAMGVSALTGMSLIAESKTPHYKSSIDLRTLHWIENLLGGPILWADGRHERTGLRAPKWPGALFPESQEWKIDLERVKKGRGLYKELCVECHRGPIDDAAFDSEWPNDSFWAPGRWAQVPGDDRKYFDVETRKVTEIGTDPAQAGVLHDRILTIPQSLEVDVAKDILEGCGLASDSSRDGVLFAPALMSVVGKTIDRWFEDNPAAEKDRNEIIASRLNCPNPKTFNGDPVYKARPLDGVWATAPYLHNGAVPNLMALLSPASERPSFWVGGREFDPVNVGYDIAPAKGRFHFEINPPDKWEDCRKGTATGELCGNGNGGHSFEGEKRSPQSLPPGVIGPELKVEDRLDLIEYLKTL